MTKKRGGGERAEKREKRWEMGDRGDGDDGVVVCGCVECVWRSREESNRNEEWR
jgi:hypothetical protein